MYNLIFYYTLPQLCLSYEQTVLKTNIPAFEPSSACTIFFCIVGYLVTMLAHQTTSINSYRQMKGSLVNDKSGRNQKALIAALSIYCFGICLEGLKKIAYKNGERSNCSPYYSAYKSHFYAIKVCSDRQICVQTFWLSLFSDYASLVKGYILCFFYSTRKRRFMDIDVLSSYV